MMAMHSSGSSAPSGWIRLKSGAIRSNHARRLAARPMRASVS